MLVDLWREADLRNLEHETHLLTYFTLGDREPTLALRAVHITCGAKLCVYARSVKCEPLYRQGGCLLLLKQPAVRRQNRRCILARFIAFTAGVQV